MLVVTIATDIYYTVFSKKRKSFYSLLRRREGRPGRSPSTKIMSSPNRLTAPQGMTLSGDNEVFDLPALQLQLHIPHIAVAAAVSDVDDLLAAQLPYPCVHVHTPFERGYVPEVLSYTRRTSGGKMA